MTTWRINPDTLGLDPEEDRGTTSFTDQEWRAQSGRHARSAASSSAWTGSARRTSESALRSTSSAAGNAATVAMSGKHCSKGDDVSADRSAELQEAIDSADYERFTTLEEAATDELMRLWGDLHHQMRDARNGCWSVGCESVAHRIAVLTKALGKATRWQAVDIELLESGVYQRFHDLMGVPYEQPDMDVIAEMRADREASLAELRAIPDLPDLHLSAG